MSERPRPESPPRHTQPDWRQDFPSDWPQDHYVERRDFMKFLVLTSLAMTVGQVWIAAQNWIRKRRGTAPIARVAALADVPIGGVVSFSYPTPQDPCVLTRLTEYEIVAYSQKCTHLSCAVIPRPDKNELVCPCHDGHFDLRTGRPTAGPPRRPLPRITLDVRGDAIYATGIDLRTS
jgi:Rieske Fe-S protein